MEKTNIRKIRRGDTKFKKIRNHENLEIEQSESRKLGHSRKLAIRKLKKWVNKIEKIFNEWSSLGQIQGTGWGENFLYFIKIFHVVLIFIITGT